MDRPPPSVLDRIKPENSNIVAFAWSPAGNRIVIACANRRLELVDPRAGDRRVIDSPSTLSALAWSSDGVLACGCEDGTIHLWNPVSAHFELLGRDIPDQPIRSLIWSPDGRTLISGSGTGDGQPSEYRVVAWDSTRKVPSKRLENPAHQHLISSLAISPDGNFLASGSHDRTVNVWSVRENWNHVKTLKLDGAVHDVTWTPDSKRVIVSKNRELLEWKYDDDQVRTFRTFTTRINSITCSSPIGLDGEEYFLAARGQDQTVRIFKGPHWAEITEIRDRSSRRDGRSIQFHPTESLLAVITDGDRRLDIMRLHAESPERLPASDNFDVAIICALPLELNSMLKTPMNWKTDEGYEDPNPNHRYHFGTLQTARKKRTLRVVLSLATHKGPVHAAVLATKMSLTFHPKFVIAVGISAGVRDSAFQRNPGDILVASESFAMDSGKRQSKDGGHEFRPEPNPIVISTDLVSTLRELQRQRTYLDDITERWTGDEPPNKLRLHLGPVATGSAVVSDGQVVDAVKTHWRTLEGVEMEIYGVYVAATEARQGTRFLSFKSICDFADKDKDDKWQRYAAFTSAQYCYQFLCYEIDRFL